MSKITTKKLGEMLGLSSSTVSRAFNDTHEISPETKQKVLDLAKKLNYQPNIYAQGLRSQSSRTIAVIVPEISNSFFALAINGIEEIAQKKGYHVLIYITHEEAQKEANAIEHLLNGRADGLLISVGSGSKDLQHMHELAENKIPTVFFDRVAGSIPTVKVTTNDEESSFTGVRHLIARGCRRIVYLSVSENLSIDQKRRKGYLRALRSFYPELQEEIISCSQDDTENYELIKKALSGKELPDGIFASVEKLAITCYEVCNELKLGIPSDIRIIGFSNLKTAELLKPSLTTITQPAYEIGKEAASALFNLLKNPSASPVDETIVIPSVLIERESTAVTPADPKT